MKIKRVTKRKVDNVPVYDVVNASPYHNFLVCNDLTNTCVVSHNCGLLDEMNFARGANEDMTQSSVMETYRAVKRRMESRFMRHGELPGILFMVSSKRSEYDFLENYVKSQMDNPNVYIVDEPVWNIKPADQFYCGKKFKVAVGNKYIKSTIVKDGDSIDGYIGQGYKIIDVPVEHRTQFELDLDSALMDIANIAITSKSKFISYDRLVKNYNRRRRNPFKSEVLQIGLDDRLEIEDFFIVDLVDDYTRSLPGFIHIDTSLRGDHTGLSYVVISGTKNVNKYNKDTTITNNVDLVYRQVFTIGIQAPSDSEISFEKTRKFIYYLREHMFNIQGVSADGFQSADTLQLLTTAGYNTKLISLDRTPAGYTAFRSAIYEERLDLFNLRDSVLESEIINLEKDAMSGKVDHPVNGSKDESDSLCGAIFNAMQSRQATRTRYAADDIRIVSEILNDDPSDVGTIDTDFLGINGRVVDDITNVRVNDDDDFMMI